MIDNHYLLSTLIFSELIVIMCSMPGIAGDFLKGKMLINDFSRRNCSLVLYLVLRRVQWARYESDVLKEIGLKKVLRKMDQFLFSPVCLTLSHFRIRVIMIESGLSMGFRLVA